MSKIKTINADWKSWIIKCVKNGCTSQSIIDTMKSNNFDESFSIEVVQDIRIGVSLNFIDDKKEASKYIYENSKILSLTKKIKTSDGSVLISAIIKEPLVVIFDGILSDEECDEIIRVSEKKLTRSQVFDQELGVSQTNEVRTSQGTHILNGEYEFIDKINSRISQVTGHPIENGEALQILKYGIGEEYKPHYDYFPFENKANDSILEKGGQRVATLVMYLNNVESGGETVFPKIGLAVTPKKGSAVYFEYCNSLNQLDENSLHGGAPVIIGEKWIATKWIRQRKI